MIKILFVCHGNICRSPMAEFIYKKLIKENNMEDNFYVKSAATSREEIGNPVYPPAKRILKEHGISCEGKTARQMTIIDYNSFDYSLNNQHWRRFKQWIFGIFRLVVLERRLAFLRPSHQNLLKNSYVWSPLEF